MSSTTDIQRPARVEPTDAQKAFRQAMAHLGAAVNVITTAGPHGRCGITASAVCSVTDTPPTLLVCLNRSSAMRATFERNRHVCINVLPAEHEQLARHFAGFTDLPMERRFDLPVWDRGEQDVPVLRDALASLQGTIADMKRSRLAFGDVHRGDVDPRARRRRQSDLLQPCVSSRVAHGVRVVNGACRA